MVTQILHINTVEVLREAASRTQTLDAALATPEKRSFNRDDDNHNKNEDMVGYIINK